MELIKSEINNIGDKQWAYSVQHVINIENNYLSATNTLNNFIINVGQSSDESNEDSDDEIVVD